jgi:Family of unknown function (DUF6152)
MSRSTIVNAALVAVVLGILAPTALAHHSSSMFAFNQRVTVEGTIVKVAWQNPHVYLTIESPGPDGKPMQQDVQAASLSMIKGFGLTREMLATGTHVKIDAAAQKSGTDHLLWGGFVTFDDGSVYLLETAGPNTHIPTVPAAAGLAGKWVPPPISIRVFLQTMQALPLNEGASAGRAVLGDPRAPASFCDTELPGIASAMLGALPVLHTVEIADKTVTMRIDADGGLVQRVVHLDQSAHPANVAPSALGHSIGRWEGGTLVIDTVGFAASPISSRVLHSVERLTLGEDKRHLNYEATLEDAELWTKPVSLSTTWDYRPDVDPSGATCDPANARRYLQDIQLPGTAPSGPKP